MGADGMQMKRHSEPKVPHSPKFRSCCALRAAQVCIGPAVADVMMASGIVSLLSLEQLQR